jgi:hypothetical protein
LKTRFAARFSAAVQYLPFYPQPQDIWDAVDDSCYSEGILEMELAFTASFQINEFRFFEQLSYVSLRYGYYKRWRLF